MVDFSSQAAKPTATEPPLSEIPSNSIQVGKLDRPPLKPHSKGVISSVATTLISAAQATTGLGKSHSSTAKKQLSNMRHPIAASQVIQT